MSRKASCKRRDLRWLTASLTAALWLFTSFLAVSHEWHHCLHEDSESSQHHCLVNKYSDGEFLSLPAPAVQTQAISTAKLASSASTVLFHGQSDRLLPPGRAPPLV